MSIENAPSNKGVKVQVATMNYASSNEPPLIKSNGDFEYEITIPTRNLKSPYRMEVSLSTGGLAVGKGILS